MLRHSASAAAVLRSSGLAACAALVALAGPALALEVDPSERDRLRACERNLCEIVLKKATTGEALQCNLQKTWAKDDIASGVQESSSLDWSLGDARCTLDLNMPQADIVSAMTKDAYSFQMPSHPAKCIVEKEGDTGDVTMNVAPKLEFENGKVTSADLGITDIDGTSVLATVVSGAVTLQNWTGLFQGNLVEEVNEFLHEKCAKRYPEFVGN